MADKTEEFLKHIASAPAIAIESTLDASKHFTTSVTKQKTLKKAHDYWKILGPGLTTGAADDDPSGVATYSQQGAQYGYQLLWLAGFTFPLMSIVQEMCGRIGIVTGRGLAANMRRHYPRWVLYICTLFLLSANILNLGADLGAMAKATQLIIPNSSFPILVTFFTILSLLLQIFTSYKDYSQYLKFLALLLFTYIFSALSIHGLDWKKIIYNTFIPTISFTKDQTILVTGILGTTISPYLFFWQPSQEVEEEILKGKTTIQMREKETSKRDIKNMRIDVWSGMFVSNLVMFFIVLACAATLNASGIKNIQSAEQAAAALKPLAGEYSSLLFTLGIVGAGLLAVPVLAGSASYAISETLRWKFGLYRSLKEASAFYGVIIFSMIIGFAINFVGFDPIKALIYSAILNGLIAPIILFFIVKISGSQKIMGQWKNGPISNFIGWLITIIMAVSAAATIYLLFT